MGEGGVSELVRPALIVPAPPRAAWGLGGTLLDRHFTRIAVLPTFVVMLGIFGMPLAFSFYLSFTGWEMDQPLFSGHFVGFDNYRDLLTDPAFTGSLGITFGYTAAAVAAGGTPVFAVKGESLKEYWDYTHRIFEWSDGGAPNMILDDGGDATLLMHLGS